MNLYAIPLWFAGLIIVGGTVFAVLAAQLFIRRRVGLDTLRVNNEVAGFKYGTLGVMYAVLLAFIVIAVWNNFRDARGYVENEAASLAALYLFASGLEKPARGVAAEAVRRYTRNVIEDEWPAMSNGAASDSVRRALQDLFRTYAAFEPVTPGDVQIQQASLRLLVQLAENRQNRIDSAGGTLPAILWLAVIEGAIVVVGFTLFFGAPNIGAQLAMTGLLAATVAFVVTVTFALDRPFAGDCRCQPGGSRAGAPGHEGV
jgi:hypothetical protein